MPLQLIRAEFKCGENILNKLFQMGQTTHDVWEFLGLDKIPSCLATSNNNDCTGNQLESRIRIDINPRTTSFELCML